MKFTRFTKQILFLALTVSFLVQPLVVFASAPTVTALNVSFTTTTATLFWNTPADASLVEFEIRYIAGALNDGNFNFGTQVSGPTPEAGTTQSLVVSSLNPSVNYTFGIRTRNFLGEESPIVYVSGSTPASGGGGTPIEICTKPTAATSFQAPIVTASAVSLSWNLPNFSNLSDLQVRYSTTPINDGTFNFATQATGAPNPEANATQNFTVSGLTSNTNYYFAIKLWNACGEESLITSVSAITASAGGGGACTVPSLPTSLAIGGVTANSLNMSWITPNQSSLSELDVRYSNQPLNDGNFNFATRLSVPNPEAGTTQSVTATGLVSNTNYYFGLRVQNACGDYSGIVYVGGATNNLPPITNFSGGGGGGSAVAAKTGISINQGVATTRNRLVTLDIDAERALEMWLSEDKKFETGLWEPFASTTSWILSSELGTKTVYAKFRDDRFTGFDQISDSIELLSPLPTTSTSPVGGISPATNVPVVSGSSKVNGKVWLEIIPEKIKVSGNGEVRVAVIIHTENSYEDYFRLALNYPSQILALKSVQFAPGLLPDFSPTGSVENVEQGLIVKSVTSEVPIIGRKLFAVLVFTPLHTGEGNLELISSANYQGGGWRSEISVISNPDSNTNLLASLVSPGKENNVSAMFAIWAFFILIYAGYLAFQKYTKGL
jgi:hypothetical protein